MNTFGTLFRLTTFGESHGPAMGAVIDGCPAGVALSQERVQAALDRRRPGQSSLASQRKELDQVELLSGVYQDKTLGTPIAAVVRNQDARPEDYAPGLNPDRPGHADRVWRERYYHLDPRGGGRTSGRETLSRVIGGAIAEALMERELPGLRVVAWVAQVGPISSPVPEVAPTRAQVAAHAVRCPDPTTADRMASLIMDAKAAGDTYGGSIDLRIEGLPIGVGEPVFGKLKAELASAMAGIGTVTGVVWGPADLSMALTEPGSVFFCRGDFAGGVQGGLSNGEPLQMRIFSKPASTMGSMAKSGRHDPCILPRAVPVVEAMASLVLANLWLRMKAQPHQP